MHSYCDCIITYQKNNGEILIRPYHHSYGKHIGEETSMGWKIVDIHYKRNGNYYCYEDFIRIFKNEIKGKHRRKFIKFFIKTLNKYSENVN